LPIIPSGNLDDNERARCPDAWGVTFHVQTNRLGVGFDAERIVREGHRRLGARHT
jgi:hypothetical protein